MAPGLVRDSMDGATIQTTMEHSIHSLVWMDTAGKWQETPMIGDWQMPPVSEVGIYIRQTVSQPRGTVRGSVEKANYPINLGAPHDGHQTTGQGRDVLALITPHTRH